MKSTCVRVIQVLNEADLMAGPAPCFDAEALSHLDGCPACREEYRAFSEARQLFATLSPVEPDPSFGTAWREKLREAMLSDQAYECAQADKESTPPSVKMTVPAQKQSRMRLNFPLFQNWQWAAGFGAVVIIALCTVCFTGPWRQSPQPNQGLTRHAGEASGERIAALDEARYQLRIVKSGPQKKWVQRIIRDYHRLTEGGASYAFRDPETGLVFRSMTLQQARNLKRELEKAGAVVQYVREK